MKELKADKQALLLAAQASTIVAPTTDLNSIRLLNDKPIPPLKTRKRKHSDFDLLIDKEGISIDDTKSPHLFLIKTKSEEINNFNVLQKKIEKAFPRLKILYIRINHCRGHLLVSSNNTTEEDMLMLDGYKGVSQGHRFLIKSATKEQSKEFYKKHGSHYEMITKNRVKENVYETRKAKKKAIKELTKIVKSPYIINNEQFTTINEIKDKAKSILNSTKIGAALKENDKQFITELLSHHKKYRKEMPSIVNIVVDVHPMNKALKCFFMAEADGKKAEFSVVKCIEGLIGEKVKETVS